jgi:hypothetical protein
MYENSIQWNSLKLLKRRVKDWGELRKNNTDWVNLVKVHFIHSCNITLKTICTLIYANKTFKELKSLNTEGKDVNGSWYLWGKNSIQATAEQYFQSKRKRKNNVTAWNSILKEIIFQKSKETEPFSEIYILIYCYLTSTTRSY